METLIYTLSTLTVLTVIGFGFAVGKEMLSKNQVHKKGNQVVFDSRPTIRSTSNTSGTQSAIQSGIQAPMKP